MGNSLIIGAPMHMNVDAISYINTMSTVTIFEMLANFESKLDNTAAPKAYSVSLIEFKRLIKRFQVTSSVDRRGFQDINILDVFISFTACMSGRLQDRLATAFRILDRPATGLVSREELLHILTVLNTAVTFFGDRPLLESQLLDLADSLYTSMGQIDGPIGHYELYDAIASHPIVEMFLSPQYQGHLTSKLMDESHFIVNTQVTRSS
eukprot:gene8023-16442_t